MKRNGKAIIAIPYFINRYCTLILQFCLFMLACSSTLAHESRPLYVEIIERSEYGFDINWKIPPSANAVAPPYISMPSHCHAQARATGSALIKRQFFHCRATLSGEKISIVWPDYNPSISTLLRLKYLTGETRSTILGPDTLQWQVPNKEDTASIAGEYLLLGVEHILLGFDHLLFVACLVFIAGTLKRILITVTGFTLAHSLTLTLAALGLVRVPIAAVETIIALSIVFLATEIGRTYLLANTKDQQDTYKNTLTWRYPVVVASLFGLLHGFGFASVLSEIGLPQTELPVSLLFFNIGVEVGQVAFILLILACFILLSKHESSSAVKGQPSTYAVGVERVSKPLQYLCIYSIGLLSSYWMIDRLAGAFT